MTRQDDFEAVTDDDAAQVLVSRDGIVRYWSVGCERLFGYSQEAILGASVDYIILPRLRAGHHAGLAAAMATKSLDRASPVGNIPVVHADGSVRLHPFRQVQLCDAFGRGTGAIVTFSDAVEPGAGNGLRDVFDLEGGAPQP